jgi:hypothetical protein
MNSTRKKACPRLAETAAWALDAENERDARRLAAHVARCPECAAEAQAVRATVRQVRAAARREPAPDLTRRIMQALPAEPAARPAFHPAFLPLRYAAAAVLLAVGAGVLALRVRDRRQTQASLDRERLTRQADAAASWIAAQQESDGTWRPSLTGGNDAYRPALTALALMALQRQSPEAQAGAIRRGVAALVALQTPEGAFCRTRGARLYNHAFAANALFALPPRLARLPEVQAARNRALAFSLAAQTPQGAWDYDAEGSGNTALSIWQIALLTQARAQGWADDRGHLRRSLAWLQRQSAGRAFGYRQPGVLPPGDAEGLTLTAMAAATLLDAAREYPALQPAAEAAADALRQLRNRNAVTAPDYYRDYFLARVSAGVADLRALGEVQARLARAAAPAGAGGAHWVADDAWRTAGGDLYATSLAVLSPRTGVAPPTVPR